MDWRIEAKVAEEAYEGTRYARENALTTFCDISKTFDTVDTKLFIQILGTIWSSRSREQNNRKNADYFLNEKTIERRMNLLWGTSRIYTWTNFLSFSQMTSHNVIKLEKFKKIS